MKHIFKLLLLAIALLAFGGLSYGQRTIQYAIGTGKDTAYSPCGYTRIDSGIIIRKLASGDTNKVLTVNSEGNLILVTKLGIDTTSLSNRINAKADYSQVTLNNALSNGYIDSLHSIVLGDTDVWYTINKPLIYTNRNIVDSIRRWIDISVNPVFAFTKSVYNSYPTGISSNVHVGAKNTQNWGGGIIAMQAGTYTDSGVTGTIAYTRDLHIGGGVFWSPVTTHTGIEIHHPTLFTGGSVQNNIGISINHLLESTSENINLLIGNLTYDGYGKNKNWHIYESKYTNYPNYLANNYTIIGAADTLDIDSAKLQVSGEIKGDSIRTAILKSGKSYSQTLPLKSGTVALTSDVTIDNAATNNNVSTKSIQVSNVGPFTFADQNSLSYDVINGSGAATFRLVTYGANAVYKGFLAGGTSSAPTFPYKGQQTGFGPHTWTGKKSSAIDSFNTAGFAGFIVDVVATDSNSNPTSWKVQIPLKGSTIGQLATIVQYIDSFGINRLYKAALMIPNVGASTDSNLIVKSDGTFGTSTPVSTLLASKTDTFTIPQGYVTLGNGTNRKYNNNLWFDTSNNTLYVDQQTGISNANRSANFRKDVNSLSGLAIINGYNGTLSSGGLLLFGDSSQLGSNVYPGQVRKMSPNYTTSGGISANDLLIQAGASGNINIKPNNSGGYIRFIHGNSSNCYNYIDSLGNLHADDSLKVNVLSASGNSYLSTTTLTGLGAFTDGFVVNNAAIRAGSARFNTTLQNAWVNIGTTNTAPALQISNNTTIRATFTYDGNFQLPTGSITTAQPSANGAGAVKFGKILTGSDSNKYQEVSIDGVNYYIKALTALP